MNNTAKYLVILISLLMVVVSGCIGSEVSNANNNIPEINNNIIKGDNYFNTAASNLNYGAYSVSKEKVQQAIDEFEEAEKKINLISDSINKTEDAVYIEYIDLCYKEISLKKKASEKLQVACDLAESNGSYNDRVRYINECNEFMRQSNQYSYQRKEIEKKYPEKFKDS